MTDFSELPELPSPLKTEGLQPSKYENTFQRTEEWFQARSGNFTGSMIKDLMASSRSTSKVGWDMPNKIFDFSVGAEGTVFKIGQERMTGFRSMEVTTKAMSHGILNEPLLVEKMVDDGVIEDFEPIEYKDHPDVPHLGASLDGLVVYKSKQMGFEGKCPSSWDGFYKRVYKPVALGHPDFWQVQTEMFVLGVEELLYVTAYPMTVQKYNVSLIKASYTHQIAIKKRVLIANDAISRWNGDYSYEPALAEAIREFKLNS